MGGSRAENEMLEASSNVEGTPYRVLRSIGSGGMGSVYEVEHVELGRRFVLKVLHERLSERKDVSARMKNEWRALAVLEHPNIVQVTDAGYTRQGLPYYVMERLEGQTVAQLIARRGRLGMREAGRIILEILQGLSVAHGSGMIHRDIKPQNLFVVSGGPVKILDFGVAKLKSRLSSVTTVAGVTIGTPRYMAPEQAEGKSVDARTDIYATALVLYEMLAGRGPFAHLRESSALIFAQMTEEPARVDWVAPGVSEEMGDLVQRWLSKDPGCRPVDAQLAAEELRSLLASLPAEELVFEERTWGGDYEASTLGPAHFSDGAESRGSEEPPHSGERQTQSSGLELSFSDEVSSLSSELFEKGDSAFSSLSTLTLRERGALRRPLEALVELKDPQRIQAEPHSTRRTLSEVRESRSSIVGRKSALRERLSSSRALLFSLRASLSALRASLRALGRRVSPSLTILLISLVCAFVVSSLILLGIEGRIFSHAGAGEIPRESALAVGKDEAVESRGSPARQGRGKPFREIVFDSAESEPAPEHPTDVTPEVPSLQATQLTGAVSQEGKRRAREPVAPAPPVGTSAAPKSKVQRADAAAGLPSSGL